MQTLGVFPTTCYSSGMHSIAIYKNHLSVLATFTSVLSNTMHLKVLSQ